MATIPSTSRKPDVPTIGLVAHVDTSPEMDGASVRPIVHERYDGRAWGNLRCADGEDGAA